MDLLDFLPQYQNLILQNVPQLSNIRPSDWVEQNIIMGAPFPGPYRYDRTPYCREIIDCFSPDHPARKIAVMKGAQIGISAGVIIPVLCWIIKESPGNTYFTVGAPDLINKSVEKLDLAIDRAGLRSYLKPQVNRKKNQKSGDTNTKKDFIDGFINITTPNNHKEWRDVSLKYGLIDDFESARNASKESGDTRKLMEQRFAAYADTHKIAYISTPELRETSNIEPAFILGDQRKYHIPCPHCGTAIEWVWKATNDDGEVIGGIHWKVNDVGHVIPESVGYVCQSCGGFFNDKRKQQMLNDGIWMPTATPSSPEFFSYHISSLYAPLGMYDWMHYVKNWIDMHPSDGVRKENEYKTFVNVVLGETYQEEIVALKANQIQRNTRDYQPFIVPESLSIADGNGRIVMLTLGSDMNGKEDDARLDWEVLAHAENGATYSVAHGSIGTFIPLEDVHKSADREKWSYNYSSSRHVWDEFERIITATYVLDTEEDAEMSLLVKTLDSGHYTQHAYDFVDRCIAKGIQFVIPIKGNKEDEMVKYAVDVPMVKPGTGGHPSLYIIQVGLYKDELSRCMQLSWIDKSLPQPNGFMNFPQPTSGLYGYQNYFEHYEAEQKKVVKNKNGSTSFRWEKKTNKHQNHMFDCRIYNMAAKDIFLHHIGKQYKKRITWADLVALIIPQG